MKSVELAKAYDPKSFEERIYEMWKREGLFKPEIDKNKRPFTIVIPPPNVTGALHLGHALDNCLQDIQVRYRRMKEFDTMVAWYRPCGYSYSECGGTQAS